VRLELDENLGVRGAQALERAGHEVATVAGQGMTSATDLELIDRCRAERRCLVTLDLDFSNPIRFPPARYHGIVVLRLPARFEAGVLEELVDVLAAALRADDIDGQLWIVEPGRVRAYAPAEPVE
jgi:predicted nuclease of predicted toxin-antitoxin system